jgi:hypothetical protein
MVDKGLHDGESRQLAVKLVSGRFDTMTLPDGKRRRIVTAWGKKFIAPDGKVCATQDDACEIEKIWDFIVLNLRYVYDTVSIDVFSTLRESLVTGGADCDDMTIAFATLLGSIGFHVVARVISLPDDPKAWAHIYPMVGLPKDNPDKWLPLDASVKGATPGWEYSKPAMIMDYQLTRG